MLPFLKKLCKITKRLKTPEEVEKYFPGFLAFIDNTIEQSIPRPINNIRCEICYSSKNKRHIIKTQLMVNDLGTVIHKLRYKKGRRDMTMISIIRIIR